MNIEFPILTKKFMMQYPMIVVIVKLFLLTYPTNFVVKRLINYKKGTDDNEIKNGRKIGALERIIMFLLMILGEIGAIALICTCKSIARYKQFDKDPKFAERYLIGTLLSILITILIYIV